MNLEDLTLRQVNELKNIFNSKPEKNNLDNNFIGQYVIIRTYSAGVHSGILHEKSGNEVILKNARRMWYWKAKKSISLSAVANYGITEDSRIAPAVDNIWLEAIEIIPCTREAQESISGAKDAKAE